MFTVCPKCALTLIVTAADLRDGQMLIRRGKKEYRRIVVADESR